MYRIRFRNYQYHIYKKWKLLGLIPIWESIASFGMLEEAEKYYSILTKK